MSPIPFVIGSFGSLILAATTLVGQINSGADVGDTSLWISGAATTATASALVYVVRQIASGNLVHRAAAQAETQLTELVRVVTEVAEEGHQREQDYRQMLMSRQDSQGL